MNTTPLSEAAAVTPIDPVVKRMAVNETVEAAFERFTLHMASWWPLSTHSVWGDDAETVIFDGHVGGTISERHRDGRTSVWGTVQVWEPPARVVFTFHPARDPDTAGEIELTFTAGTDDTTEIILEHRNWEALGDRAVMARDGYDLGWDHVLAHFTGSPETE